MDNTKASCRFHVHVGKKEVWATEILRANSTPRTISVPLEGAKEFDLIEDDAGDGRGWDQADWADARVALEDGSELWLDNLLVAGGLPFSFVYGGKHSSEFLGHWTREVKTEKTATPRPVAH